MSREVSGAVSRTVLAAAHPQARILGAVHPRDGVWLQDSAANLMVINSVMTFDRRDVDTLRRVWVDGVMG